MPSVIRKRTLIDILMGVKKEDIFVPPKWDDDDPTLGIYGPDGKLASVVIERDKKPDSKDSKN